MPDEIKKNFPQAAPEIAETLGFSGKAPETVGVTPPPVDLPVVEAEAITTPEKVNEAQIEADVAAIKGNTGNQRPIFRIAKAVAPYVAVFAVGVFLYYYYFSDFTWYSIEKKPTQQTQKQTVNIDQQKYDALLASERGKYNVWISQFYFDVSDASILDPATDNSGNGLNNFQKYLLGLNPRAFDTLGLGMSDAQAVKQGINPLTGTELTDYQKEVIKEYLNLDGVAINVPEKETTPVVATSIPTAQAASAPVSAAAPLVTAKAVPKTVAQPARNVAPTSVTYTPTNTAGVTVTQNPTQPLFNRFGLDAARTNNLNIDFAKPALLEIPAMDKSVPVIWAQGGGSDLDFITKQLNNGVVHLPTTPLPGDLGRSYISGHSSGYVWDTAKYKDVFRNLSLLETTGSKFYVTVYTKDGKTIKLTYTTYGYHIYDPGDQAQFENTADSEVALSTCWPIGGTKERLVVFARLTDLQR